MTPVLSAVYDELVTRACTEPWQARARQWVEQFIARTGQFPADHPQASQRMAAGWEDALCRSGLGRELALLLDDQAERELAAVVLRSHRGVFAFELVGRFHLMHDLISGASFILVARDSIGREVQGDNFGGLCQARLVAGADGCAMLPGVVFHLPEATAAIRDVIAFAHQQRLSTDAICDALLRMDHQYRTMSRVRPAYAYRCEALVPKVRADGPA